MENIFKKLDKKVIISLIVIAVVVSAFAFDWFKNSKGGTDYSQVKVSGQNYYVDNVNGSDRNNGLKPKTAFKTLNKVNQLDLQAGDAVNFANGAEFRGKLRILKSGTKDNPILFRTYGEGNTTVINARGQKNGVVINGNNVIFDGISVKNSKAATIIIWGSNNIISKCDLSNAGEGVRIKGDGNTVTYCNIHDMHMIRNTPGGNDDYGATGVGITSSNNIVSNNNFYNLIDKCYDYGKDGGAIEFYNVCDNNKIINNTATNTDGFIEAGSAVNGSLKNLTVSGNTASDIGHVFIGIHVGGKFGTNPDNLIVTDNTITNSSIKKLVKFWNGSPRGSVIEENNKTNYAK